MARVRKQVAQINVVPLIDVMLVLLVVFMITAPFINPGQVELPSVGKTASAPNLPIEVTLKEDGGLSVKDRGGNSPERSISQAELGAVVKSIQRQRPDAPVVIAADKNVRYEAVMNLMTALQQARVARIGLLAKPAP
ncbi:MAG TPA: ExbD/TolR family protein [Thiobacillaceae bacterium]|nr:ExbD/TolR family protein [Thiobacillaceae bacterium]